MADVTPRWLALDFLWVEWAAQVICETMALLGSARMGWKGDPPIVAKFFIERSCYTDSVCRQFGWLLSALTTAIAIPVAVAMFMYM